MLDVTFNEEERTEIRNKVIPELIKTLTDIPEEDMTEDILFEKVHDAIMKYNSLYKRLKIVIAIAKTNNRMGYNLPFSRDVYAKLFDHKYLHEDDYNNYEERYLIDLNDLEKLAKNILDAYMPDPWCETYIYTWKNFGKCKTCNRDVELNRGEYLKTKMKIEKNPKYRFPTHCVHCRRLKREKKLYKMPLKRKDGNLLNDIEYKMLKKKKNKQKKIIKNIQEFIDLV